MAGEDSDTSIKLYLREIMRVQLLTPQDEITLAARIKKGDTEARAWMIKANLRLVVNPSFSTRGVSDPGRGSKWTSCLKGLHYKSYLSVLV
jgi:DNA-directed RNA polymerase sigma subunit (sigma70/sigma32)